jgi:hypothetical protein
MRTATSSAPPTAAPITRRDFVEPPNAEGSSMGSSEAAGASGTPRAKGSVSVSLDGGCTGGVEAATPTPGWVLASLRTAGTAGGAGVSVYSSSSGTSSSDGPRGDGRVGDVMGADILPLPRQPPCLPPWRRLPAERRGNTARPSARKGHPPMQTLQPRLCDGVARCGRTSREGLAETTPRGPRAVSCGGS